MRWFYLFTIWLALCASALAQDICPVEIVKIEASPALQGGQYPENARWQTVTLPDDGWKQLPMAVTSGERAGSDGLWYRIKWQRSCDNPRDHSLALVLESIVLAGEVYINNHQLWQDPSLVEPLTRSWNMPRLLRLPETHLLDGINTIRIRVVSIPGQHLGLGSVFLGETRPMQKIYDGMLWRNRTLFTINMIVSGVLGIFFLALWIAHRNDSAYGWFALSTMFWLLFAFSVLATDPWPFTSTASVTTVFLAGLILAITTFCIFTWRLSEQSLPRIERALWSLSALLLLVLIFTPFNYAIVAHSIVASLMTMVFAVNCLLMPVHAWRTRNPEHILLAICLLALFVLSVHDYLQITDVFSSSVAIMPYASIAITLCLAGIMGFRYAKTVRRNERFNQELKDAVEAAQTELSTTLEHQYGLALTNTRLQDRLQLAHDLHDGLGGSLLHIMATVEQSPQMLNRERVLSMLKLLRDDLRQTIDLSSSEGTETPDTPKEWIAPLRHRFTSLFDHFNIRSDWKLPDEWLKRPNAMQCLVLTRLVEEGLTNVVRHSHAKNVWLRLVQDNKAELTLEIEDDGIGFDVIAVRQSGLSVGMRSMTMRITRLNGTLSVESTPGKTLLSAEFIVVNV